MDNSSIRRMATIALAVASLFPVGCQSVDRAGGSDKQHGRVLHTETGVASYYSVRCNRGSRTASGRRLVDDASTAAHRRWAFGSHVRVTNLSNGKTEVVTITDRGPHVRGRIIDVTIGVARRLGFAGKGLAKVKIEALEH
jgi:rare lipoprotein A